MLPVLGELWLRRKATSLSTQNSQRRAPRPQFLVTKAKWGRELSSSGGWEEAPEMTSWGQVEQDNLLFIILTEAACDAGSRGLAGSQAPRVHGGTSSALSL